MAHLVKESFFRSGYTYRVFDRTTGNLIWSSATVYTRIEAGRERARAEQRAAI